jgi:hypothetical protein
MPSLPSTLWEQDDAEENVCDLRTRSATPVEEDTNLCYNIVSSMPSCSQKGILVTQNQSNQHQSERSELQNGRKKGARVTWNQASGANSEGHSETDDKLVTNSPTVDGTTWEAKDKDFGGWNVEAVGANQGAFGANQGAVGANQGAVGANQGAGAVAAPQSPNSLYISVANPSTHIVNHEWDGDRTDDIHGLQDGTQDGQRTDRTNRSQTSDRPTMLYGWYVSDPPPNSARGTSDSGDMDLKLMYANPASNGDNKVVNGVHTAASNPDSLSMSRKAIKASSPPLLAQNGGKNENNIRASAQSVKATYTSRSRALTTDSHAHANTQHTQNKTETPSKHNLTYSASFSHPLGRTPPVMVPYSAMEQSTYSKEDLLVPQAHRKAFSMQAPLMLHRSMMQPSLHHTALTASLQVEACASDGMEDAYYLATQRAAVMHSHSRGRTFSLTHSMQAMNGGSDDMYATRASRQPPLLQPQLITLTSELSDDALFAVAPHPRHRRPHTRSCSPPRSRESGTRQNGFVMSNGRESGTRQNGFVMSNGFLGAHVPYNNLSLAPTLVTPSHTVSLPAPMENVGGVVTTGHMALITPRSGLSTARSMVFLAPSGSVTARSVVETDQVMRVYPGNMSARAHAF